MSKLRRQVGSLDNLVAFEAAARLGNFSRAAEELGRAQPAISRRVKQLETYLGVDLFLRRGTRVSCTRAGREFYAAVSDALARVHVAAERLAAPETQVVALRVNVAAASLWLMPSLHEFYERHPQIRLNLVCIDEMPEVSDLDFDLEIRFGSEPWQGLECHPLLDEQVYPVASPEFVARHGGLEALDLSSVPLLELNHFTSPLMDWDSWRPVSPGQTLRKLTTYAMLIEAAIRGHGIALGWHYYVEAAIARGDLVRLPYAARTAGHHEYLTVHPGSAGRETVQKARDWLLELAARTRSQA